MEATSLHLIVSAESRSRTFKRSLAMLHSIVAPNVGHPIVHHFGEGAAVWGQAITPSVAHLVQGHREIVIDYSLVGPGIVFAVSSSVAMLPHILDTATFRLHADAAAFRHAANRPDASVDAVVRCEVGDDCVLKLWGRATAEDAILPWNQTVRTDRDATVPVLFKVSFWEISRLADARMRSMIKDAAEKDTRICELEARVALSACSQ
jgi:hypothetical protein